MVSAGRKIDRRGLARDLVDGMTTAWRREMPEVDRVDVELTRRVARLGVILQDRLAACLAPWGLNRTDYNILNVLRAAGAPYELRPMDLRDRLLLSSGGISNVLNRLSRSGLVERERDGQDGRTLWVRLTAHGVETAEATMRAWATDQKSFYQHVTKYQARAASDALREVLLAIGDHEPGEPHARSRQARADGIGAGATD